MSRIIGVDLGGTWIRIGSMSDADESSAEIDVQRLPSPVSWESFAALLGKSDGPDVAGFAIAASGPVHDHATVIAAPNLPWLAGRRAKRELEWLLRKNVVICNDMEAATEAERSHGVLRAFDWALFDTISTGWGGNLILGGTRVDGEPGHANVSFNVPDRCSAGHVGCYESLYSGSAIERRIREHRKAESTNTAANDWEYFQQHVNKRQAWAISILDDWAEGVGRAWGNTLNRIRPLQAIAYMGTTAEAFLANARVVQRLRGTLEKICMFPEHRADDFPILRAQVEHRGVVGAAIVYRRLAVQDNPHRERT